MHRSLALVLLLTMTTLIPRSPAAQDAPIADVDVVFGLDAITDINLAAEDGSMLVTMQQRVMRFGTFPLRLTANVNLNSDRRVPGTEIRLRDVHVDGITALPTDKDDLLILGEGTNPETSQRGGLILGVSGSETLKDPPAVPNVTGLASTPFTQAFFSPDGRFYAVSPTWPSVISIERDTLLESIFGEADKLIPDDIFLECGSPGQFSVLRHGNAKYYVATMADLPFVEIGRIALNYPLSGEKICFSPTSPNQLIPTNFYGLKHQLIAPSDKTPKGAGLETSLLVFDPLRAELAHYVLQEFSGRVIPRRTGTGNYDLLSEIKDRSIGETYVGIMAADDAGQTILIGYRGTNTVHRLSLVDDAIEYRGSWDFAMPVQGITVAANGSMIAVWTRETGFNGKASVTLVRNPTAVAPFKRLPNRLYSIRELQANLKDAGFSIQVDGILGTNTEEAFLEFKKNIGSAPTGDVGEFGRSESDILMGLAGVLPLSDGLSEF